MIQTPADLVAHESAHAAMGLLLGMRVRAVSRVPGGGHDGYVLVEVSPRCPADAAKEMVSSWPACLRPAIGGSFGGGVLTPGGQATRPTCSR
jgi:hypothetical protein